MRNRLLTPPEVTETSRLAALKQHPSWADLRHYYENIRDQKALLVGRSVIRTFEPIDQRKADYEHGFWDGVFTLLDTPEKAEKRLEDTLRDVNGKGTS